MRILLGLIAACLFLPASALASTPGAAAFEIFMNGKPVGRHSVTVARDGADARADVRIDMAGRVGPFSFTYAHRCTESWRGGELASLACEDREGRKVRTLRAQRTAEGLALRANDGAQTLLSGAPLLPSSWWRVETAQAARLIDTRNGKVLPVRVRKVGVESVKTPDGIVNATRYQLDGSTRADLWYDSDGRWVKLAFRLRGQNFEYRLATPVANLPKA